MPRSTAPARWTPMPAGHHRHGKNRALLRQFGASGPLAFDVLLSEAATVAWRERGLVQMSWEDFNGLSGIPDATNDLAREHLEALVLLGWVEIRAATEFGFTAFLPKYREWDFAPATPAERKAKQRAREAQR